MLKSTAGGGGIGMQLCRTDAELRDAYQSVERLARSNFSQGGVFLEKYVERARHIEVQMFGDGRGVVVTLGERDCSVQRRNQKVIEETPAPRLDEATRLQLWSCARRLGEAVAYRSAGTVEFVYDDATARFYFLEVNTRLQVEHGVTEEVTGIDLVEWMIRVAAGDPPDLRAYSLHAARSRASSARLRGGPGAQFPTFERSVVTRRIAGRMYASITGSRPEPRCRRSTIRCWRRSLRMRTHANCALERLSAALCRTRIDGIETNQAYLQGILADEVFRAGRQFTRYLQAFEYRPRTIEVIQPGTHTTVQDFPGRVGYWDIGVPPSGPMDDLAFRLANRLVGNDESAAGLEITVSRAHIALQRCDDDRTHGCRYARGTQRGEYCPGSCRPSYCRLDAQN